MSALILRWLITMPLIFLIPPQSMRASYCPQYPWTLNTIARSPVLVVGRIVSLSRPNGPHFIGDPKKNPAPQKMTAAVDVLRFVQQPETHGAPPARNITLQFVGRDGPDFSFCPTIDLPDIQAGQTLLLPLSGNDTSGPWQLFGRDGPGMITRVAEQMGKPEDGTSDSRAFIIRELVNSLHGAEPMARYDAASILATQDYYVQPEFTGQLEKSLGNDQAAWIRFLEAFLLSYAGETAPAAMAPAGSVNPSWEWFRNFPLAQLALSHLSGPAAEVEIKVWQGILSDLAAFADDPYHPLFSYSSSPAMSSAVNYLYHYGENPVFISALKSALREDRPGSSSLAYRLIIEGQKGCLPEALDRALRILRRPENNGDDIASAVHLIAMEGTNKQRRQASSIARHLTVTNPDYASYLQRQLQPTHTAALQ